MPLPLRINGALLGDLVKAAGGTDAFLAAWVEASPDPDDNINRFTLRRWIKGEAWPKDSTKFVRLAALLDVDPFALLAPASTDNVEIMDWAISIVQNRSQIPPAIGFLHDFFLRRQTWPPRLAGDARRWHTREFEHDPALRSNCYALIRLASDAARVKDRPQTFHFAYRHPVLFGGRWLQYGLVFRHGLAASLRHISGHAGQLSLSTLADATPVKTWFGPGPAIFCVASLHGFELHLTTEYAENEPALVFPG